MPPVQLAAEDGQGLRVNAPETNGGVNPMTQRSTTDHEEWVSQLEQLTKDRAGEYVTLEILHPAYGDEPEAERLPFTYAADDPRDDVVIIAVGGNTPKYPVMLRHLI